jgi:hypothetical protein
MHEYVEIDILDNINAVLIWSKHKLGDPQGTSARCHLYPRTEYVPALNRFAAKSIYRTILWSNTTRK